MKGDIIDRYGSNYGRFLSPYNTPMEMRALPHTANLDLYNVYEVAKPFEVESSTIAPAFGKMGWGTQYYSPVSVNVLLQKGIIIPVSAPIP